MNNLNKISLFRSYFDVIPDLSIALRDFCINVINGDYKDEITKLRKLIDKKKRDAIKATLPAVTVSGLFSKRNKDGLIQHSGFICIDIDEAENPQITDWPALRNSLAGVENVYFAALSASGKGLFLFIPISTPSKHELHFTALEMDFKAIGLTIDKACKDVSRLRGISYDPDAVINENAEPYKRIYQQPQQPKHFNIESVSTDQRIKNAKKWLDKNFTFSIGNRHNYIKQYAAVLHRFGVDEATAYNELLNYQQNDFKPHEIEAIIKYMYSNPTYKNCAI